MSLEGDVNKRISAARSPAFIQPQEVKVESFAPSPINAEYLIRWNYLCDEFKKDVPYAHKVMQQANSVIFPLIQDFKNQLGRFPIINLEGGISYNLQEPFVFGSLDYSLIWGKIYPTEYYKKYHFFGDGESQWERVDYSNFNIHMETGHKDDREEFGTISGTLLPRHFIYIEKWLESPNILIEAIRSGLEHPDRFLFNRKRDLSTPSWDGSRGQ